MTPPNEALRCRVETLSGCLDEQIELLHLRRRQLEQLTALLTERAYEQVEALLAEIERTQQDHREAELRLRAARESLASCRGEPVAQFRLERLLADLPQEQAAGLDYKRRQIRLLAEELKKRNFQAAMVLHESARVNRMLLACLTPRESVQTYGARGNRLWRGQGGLVDAER